MKRSRKSRTLIKTPPTVCPAQEPMGLAILKCHWAPFTMSCTEITPGYSFVDCDACVVLKVNGETVVLNGPDDTYIY